MSEHEPLGSETVPSLSESLGFQETVVELGVGHPAVRRVLAGSGATTGFVVSLDDDRMTAVEVEIGLGHRGFEKEVESRSWREALPYVSRLGYETGVLCEIAYCGAVESLSEIELPVRAVWLRTLAAELSRAADHFARLAAIGAAIALPGAEQAARAGSELAMRVLALAVGRGPIAGFAFPGGVASDLPGDFADLWPSARAALESRLARFEVVGARNPSLRRRLRGVGRLTQEQAIAWGVTGPALRATGMAVDRRREATSAGYDDLAFELPIGEQGDSLDRLLVVVEEIRQSLGLAEQCLERLDRLGSDVIAVEGLERGEPSVPAGAGECSVESSNGELGFYVVSDGGERPLRVRCRAPSFLLAQALPQTLVGESLDDLLPIVASMRLLCPEIDR